MHSDSNLAPSSEIDFVLAFSLEKNIKGLVFLLLENRMFVNVCGGFADYSNKFLKMMEYSVNLKKIQFQWFIKKIYRPSQETIDQNH